MSRIGISCPNCGVQLRIESNYSDWIITVFQCSLYEVSKMFRMEDQTMLDASTESLEGFFLFLCYRCSLLDRGTVPLCLSCLTSADCAVVCDERGPLRADSPAGLALWNGTAEA
jgi:hypothetical protein